MRRSITCLITAISLLGIQTSPGLLSPSSAHEHKTINQNGLIAQSTSTVESRDIMEFKGAIVTLGVSPDGDTLIVGSNDGQIVAISLNNFEEIYSLPLRANPYSDIVFSSDGQFFAVAQKQIIYIYQTDTGKQLKTLKAHTGNISGLAINPDDRTLVSSSGQDLTIKIWDLATGDLRQDIKENIGAISTIAFHPNGTFFATGAENVGSDRIIKYWEAKEDGSAETFPTYELVETLPKQFGFIYDLSFDSKGEKLVAAVRNYLKVWDVQENNNEILALKVSSLDLNRIAISPDSRFIATANREGKIQIIDVNTKNIIATLTGHEGWVQAIAFSPDGQKLYSGADDKIVKIWDISGL
jgi:WD40 repeat protein